MIAVVEVAVLTDVVELVEDYRTLGVNCVGDGAEAGDDRVVTVSEVAAGEYGSGVHGHRLDDDHRCASTCTF